MGSSSDYAEHYDYGASDLSVEDRLVLRLQELKREHERNMERIETLEREKREANDRARRAHRATAAAIDRVREIEDGPLQRRKGASAKDKYERPPPKSRSWRDASERTQRKKLKEEAEMRVRVKARPVPASTLLPLYEEMVRREEEKSATRRLGRRDDLRNSMAPFEGMERREMEQKRRRRERARSRAAAEKLAERRANLGVKGNRVTVKRNAEMRKSYEDWVADKEQKRKLKIAMRAADALASSRLPPRMDREGTSASAMRKSKAVAEASKELTFKPKINRRVPDFERAKRAWETKLERSRIANRQSLTTTIDADNMAMFSESAERARAAKERRRGSARRQRRGSNAIASDERPRGGAKCARSQKSHPRMSPR